MQVESFKYKLNRCIRFLANTKQISNNNAFLQCCFSVLSSIEKLPPIIECYYEGMTEQRKPMQLHGYALSEDKDVCNIFISAYRGDSVYDSCLDGQSVHNLFQRAYTFVERAAHIELNKSPFYSYLEESSPIYTLAKFLYDEVQNIKLFNFFLITDVYCEKPLRSLMNMIEGTPICYKVCDFDFLSSTGEKIITETIGESYAEYFKVNPNFYEKILLVKLPFKAETKKFLSQYCLLETLADVFCLCNGEILGVKSAGKKIERDINKVLESFINVFGKEVPKGDDSRLQDLLEIANNNKDYSQIDYEDVFCEAVKISPNLENMVSYIRQIKPPQFGEWRKLISKAHNGDSASLDRIIAMYMRTVLKMSVDYSKQYCLPLEDIFQDGLLGLHKAVFKYSEDNDVPFPSYFSMWVRQNIFREAVKYWDKWIIPIHVYEDLIKAIKYIKDNTLSLKYDKEIILEYLFAEFEHNKGNANTTDYVNGKDYAEIIFKCLNFKISLEDLIIQINKNDYMDLSEYYNEIEYIGYEDRYNKLVEPDDVMVDIVFKSQLKEYLKNVLNNERFSEKEVNVLELRYGLSDGCEKTLEDVGKYLGVTRERIRQIENKVMTKLRHKKWGLREFYKEIFIQGEKI